MALAVLYTSLYSWRGPGFCHSKILVKLFYSRALHLPDSPTATQLGSFEDLKGVSLKYMLLYDGLEVTVTNFYLAVMYLLMTIKGARWKDGSYGKEPLG